MKYAREYSRNQILKYKLAFHEGWIKLHYSAHAFSRLKERLKGDIIVYPRVINVSSLNIYKGYSFDGKNLYKIIVRLEFKKSEWIYLVILPDKKLVKTLWFRGKKEWYKENDRGTMDTLPRDLE